MSECVFCRIIKKELQANIQYEDDEIIAFDDINPQAPIHIIIIPKEHRIKSVADMTEEDKPIVGRLIYTAKKIGEKKGLTSENGYRLVFNVGPDGGATVVDHIHLHLIGGSRLGREG